MLLTKKPTYLYLTVLTINSLAVLLFVIQPFLELTWKDFLGFLHQVKTTPIAMLNHTFDSTFLRTIKTFLSRGILLFLTFWVSIYILVLIKWKSDDLFYRRICFILSCGLILGTIGVYAHSQTRLQSYTTGNPITTLQLQKGDELQQIITFSQFENRFFKLLKRAEAGEIKLSILNTNSANDHQDHDATRALYRPDFRIGVEQVDSTHFPYLDPKQITTFLRTKQLSYVCRIEREGLFYLYLRAAGKPMTSRTDTLILNNKIIPLLDFYQQTDYFPLVFRFEDLSGKPLVAFY